MKYSERFFEFPIRIYDTLEASKALKDSLENGNPFNGPWISGRMKMDFRKVDSWTDYFDSVQGVDGVEKDGFKFTLVWDTDGTPYVSTWNRLSFEKALDKFVDKYEEWEDTLAEELQAKLSKIYQEQGVDPQN